MSTLLEQELEELTGSHVLLDQFGAHKPEDVVKAFRRLRFELVKDVLGDNRSIALIDRSSLARASALVSRRFVHSAGPGRTARTSIF